MNKEKQNLNNANSFKLSGYAIKFNEADANGIIISEDAINIEDFKQMKIAGTILDYEIDDNGVKIIKKFDLRSVSF